MRSQFALFGLAGAGWRPVFPALAVLSIFGQVGDCQCARAPGSIRVMLDLALLGVFGGLYSVPLYALIEQRAEQRHLYRIIAANNILNALFIVAACAYALGRLRGSGFSRNKAGRNRRLPGRLFAEIPVRFAPAVAPRCATALRLELIVGTLRGDDR